MYFTKNTSKGFTILELLVVIAIVGILSAVVLSSISSARKKSRDSTRKEELYQMRTALELYFDANGAYPSTGNVWFSSDPSGDPGISHNGGDWIPGLVASGFIPFLPSDPLGGLSSNPSCGGGWHRAFLYRSANGSGYKLLSHCAAEGTMLPNDPFYDPNRATWAWRVCSGSDCNF